MPHKAVIVPALVILLICAPLLAWQMRGPVSSQRQDVLERLLLEHLADQPDVTALAKKRAAAYADHQFWEKFNGHVDALMTIRADELEHKKNIKHFQEAEHSFAKMLRDPGWMSGKK